MKEFSTITIIIPELDMTRVANKDLLFMDLSGFDLSDIDFTDVDIRGANLKETNAHIDPQKVKNKDITCTNLEGLNLGNADFTNVSLNNTDIEQEDLQKTNTYHIYINGTNLKKTNAHIDPQTIRNKDLGGVNLEELDLSKADFTDVKIFSTLFDIHKIGEVEEHIFHINTVITNLKGTNAHIDPQKVKDKKLTTANLEGLDLSNADFTNVHIVGTNLKGTNAHINPQKVRDKDLYGTNLEGLDLGKASFNNVYIINTNLRNTGADTTGAITDFQTYKEMKLK